ncbi:response regulator [Antarcticibacterium flavum]|uniref:Response regulator n=1 Tax=Antarcticibacterium flavum TaxID=2058175 RepID=A0A5B7X7B3_9FLAO|nr:MULTISPECIES: response regulator [Antarcticibacterium]MCM4159273.1 two-component system response regulator [Antarcticibacterium sp. W02-3]QCY71015.1 response regulator [Antarcticibacterium flavum]
MSKILLVEDDHYLGIILNDQLEMNGYDVTLLRLPGETVQKLQEEPFDLVIMDKLLSGVDGTEICADIRDTEGISNTPILMMSGLDGASKICIAAGANNFIEKPFEVDSFLESIESTLSMSKNVADKKD